uniref:Transmembrane protein n=1 Tax=Ascaris lumbricoides TaxID=6252 RepID=A0A0M3IDZ2_ASCLU
MGGWKLETGRFFALVAFPVFSFWLFNQPHIFKRYMRNYRMPDSTAGDAEVLAFKEMLAEERRKEEYEAFLREQMAFEEARRFREQHNI